MKKKLIALLLCLMLVASVAIPGTLAVGLDSAESTSEMSVAASAETASVFFGQEYANTVSVPVDGKSVLSVGCTADILGAQWQIYAPTAGVWANIYGETGSTCAVSYAMVRSMLDGEGLAKVRCLVSVADGSVVTQEVSLGVDTSAVPAQNEAPAAEPPVVLSDTVVTANTAEAPAVAAAPAMFSLPQNDEPSGEEPAGEEPAGDDSAPLNEPAPTGEESHSTYNVVINYVYENNEIVADPYTASLAAGSNFDATVTFPTVLGYLPYLDNVQQNSMDLNITGITQNHTYNVVYKPTIVDYTVIHYQQNVDNDQYTEVKRETKQGLTNSTVPDVAKTYDGFTALLYEKPAIAADGSTLVEIYYDRNYYLMNFNLDGGYGVEPIYARYGTTISAVGTPTKPGYTFSGWDQEIPQTMPAGNTSYTAKWNKCGDTAFTVAFYYENADDNGYTFMDSKVYQGTTGALVNGDAYKDEDFTGRDTKHFAYLDSETDKNVEIKGDGSTVVKVYFSRNEYTMYFYENCGRSWHNHSTACCKKLAGSITAKYNANIAQKYAEITKNQRWIRWDAGACTALVAYMPDNSNPDALKYWHDSDGRTVYNVTYAYESENGTIDHDGKKFTTLATSHVPMSYVGYSEDYLPAVRNGYSAYTDYGKAASPGFSDNGQIKTKTVTLFYYANTYKLHFKNAEKELKTENVKYNFSIASYSGFTPDVSCAPNGMVFDCWCLDSAGAQPVDWSTQKMPAGDLVLYARWKPMSHTVEFYLDHAALNAGTKLSTHPDITVSHGSKAAPTPADPTNGSYTFIGWFYMEDGVEKAFDFANMPVTKDMKVYGKWSSNVQKKYTVYYKIQGTDTQIADPTTGSGLADVTKTFEAKGGSELYAEYQEGYFPVTKSHSMTLDINATKENDTNVYTFWYVQKDAVPYTVKYLNKETGEPVATEKTVSDNRKAVVTETFVPVSGMLPDAYQKRLVVSAEEGAVNEIIFYYTKDTTHAYYKITHYTQNTDGKTWTEYASSQAVGDIGTTYTADPMTIPGFTYDSTVEGTVTSGKLTANGLELKLYYTRNSYPYQVRYLEQGSGKQLADPKNGTGKYGQVISESAIAIDNYTAVDPTSLTLNIRIEEGTETKLNIITFYYTENKVTINYQVVGPDGCGTVTPTSETLKVLSGKAQGSTATANETFRFVGWFKDAGCTQAVDASWVEENKLTPVKATDAVWTAATYYAKFEYNLTTLTITKGGGNANDSFIFDVMKDGKVEFTVSVKGNGSVTIAGLIVGDTYTVTERGSWSWRYQAEKAKTITLQPTGNNVTIQNSLSILYLLDGSDYKQNNAVLYNKGTAGN